jgi:hypothetical protein
MIWFLIATVSLVLASVLVWHVTKDDRRARAISITALVILYCLIVAYTFGLLSFVDRPVTRVISD